jgi:hypothetical protein
MFDYFRLIGTKPVDLGQPVATSDVVRGGPLNVRQTESSSTHPG